MVSANIKKRPDGKWRARYRDNERKEHSKHFGRRIDAQRWLDEVTADVLTGRYVGPNAGKETFKVYAERWRANQINHRPSTNDIVRISLEKRVYPAIGKMQLRNIEPRHIQAMVTAMSATYAPATVKVTYSYVATIFKAAIVDREIVESPCRGIKFAEDDSTTELDPKSIMTVAQVWKLHDAMPDRFKAAILVGAGLGLRQGETFGLTRDRIDFKAKRVTVDRQLVLRNGLPSELGPPKTKSSNRVIPLPQVVEKSLKGHIERYDIGESDFLFRGERGAVIRRNTFSPVWNRALKAAELEGFTFHDLRHHYASLLIHHGESVKVVQARLGHKSAQETLDTYAKVWPDSEGQTIDAVDAQLKRLAD